MHCLSCKKESNNQGEDTQTMLVVMDMITGKVEAAGEIVMLLVLLEEGELAFLIAGMIDFLEVLQVEVEAEGPIENGRVL